MGYLKLKKNHGIVITKLPMYKKNATSFHLFQEDKLAFSEKKIVKYKENDITFYKLVDGRGWIHNYVPHTKKLDGLQIVRVNHMIKNIVLSNGIQIRRKILQDHSIYLADKGYDDMSCIILMSFFKVNEVLIYLNLSENNIRDKGTNALANILTISSTLRCLELNHNKIGDNGATSLGKALTKNSILERLGLSNNLICDPGAESIASGLGKNSTLKVLNLKKNLFGIVGATAISAVEQGNKILKRIEYESQTIENQKKE